MSEVSEPKRRINWDPTVSLGHLLTSGAMIVSLIFFGARLEGRVDRVEDRQTRFEALATAQRAEDKAYEAQVFLELRAGLRRIEDILIRQNTTEAPRR